uniref:Transmembrane protein 104 homolog n=1 Tax=Cacopsylla melanoneura TaxID=428564 RepID=A0A8D9A3N6_9HEMI
MEGAEYTIDNKYSTPTGLIYIFNLIIGTGALTLPHAIQETGWILGSILLTLICFFSFVTVTFVLEAMATTNAIRQWRKLGELRRISSYLRESVTSSVDRLTDTSMETVLEDPFSWENQPLNGTGTMDSRNTANLLPNFPTEPKVLYTLETKVEMAEMSAMYFSRVGRSLFFLVLVVYLFGDLAIYCATVSKSLVNIVCDPLASDVPPINNQTLQCLHNYAITRQTTYYVFVALFVLLLGPFVFFNVHKTKYLQVLTSVMRCAAFFIMTVLATVRLFSNDLPHGTPSPIVWSGLTTMFGCGVYSFMCHHSLPSVVTPMENKTQIVKLTGFDLMLVLLVYLCLSLTGVFAFPVIADVYSLNFVPDTRSGNTGLEFVDYFLILFPVITLSTSFPIIAVTLRNNLQAILFPHQHSSWLLRDIAVPSVVVLIPVIIALSTNDISLLVGVTGSYGGACIQYVIPAFIVIFSRADLPEDLKHVPNHFRSPFKSFLWPILILVWAGITIAFVTINHIDTFFETLIIDITQKVTPGLT